MQSSLKKDPICDVGKSQGQQTLTLTLKQTKKKNPTFIKASWTSAACSATEAYKKRAYSIETCCNCLRGAVGYGHERQTLLQLKDSLLTSPSDTKEGVCLVEECTTQNKKPNIGLASVRVDPKCVKCTCVPECSDFIQECKGEGSGEKEKIQEECNEEDIKDVKCVEEHVKSVFCIGHSCDLVKGNEVGAIIMALVIYVVDMALGCAMGFFAQPSFWLGMADQKLTSGVQQAEEAAEATPTALSDARKELKSTAGIAVNAATENKAINAVSGSGLKEAAKKAAGSYFKNWMPCLPLALLGWLDAGASFMGCMAECMTRALLWNLGTLAVKMSLGCILDVLESVIGPINNGCFPGDAEVVVEGGRVLKMKDLRVGDRVLSPGGRFSDVYVLSHEEPHEVWSFIQLKTANGRAIEMTQHHFAIVSEKCDGVFSTIYAEDVTVGMCMLNKPASTSQSENLVRVIGKSIVTKQGIFNPLTFDGQLFVNGLLASSWASWFLDQAAHSLGVHHLLPRVYQTILAPARWMYSSVGSQLARKHLEAYRENMKKATENNWVITPYLDLMKQWVQVMLSSN